MKGCIRKNTNKRGVSYSVILPTGKGTDGKYKQKWVTTRTRKEAEDTRDEINRQIADGMYVNPKK